jgi:4-hydroxythreonine-4-phosphate dehydrogenase
MALANLKLKASAALGNRRSGCHGAGAGGNRVPLRLELLPEGVPPKNTKGAIFLALSRLAPTDMEYGGPSSDAGDAMYRYIKEAVHLCLSGEAAAMANGPISKEAMNRAGHYYPGHTELVAELTGCTDYVMMLAGDRLRVTLVTIHEAISNVPRRSL